MFLKLSELWHPEEQKPPKTVAAEQKGEPRGQPDHRRCHNVFGGRQIWDSCHVKFTFVLASWTRRWDCWTFHTQPFTHTALCSVKLPSDVALSEQWLSEQSPWGRSHLCKQERPGGDVWCLVWMLMYARSTLRLCTPVHTALHTCAHNVAHDQRVHLMGRCKGELPSARLCFTGGRLRGKMLKKCVGKAEPAHTRPQSF